MPFPPLPPALSYLTSQQEIFFNVKDNSNDEEGLLEHLKCSGVPLRPVFTRLPLPLSDPGSLPSSQEV